MTKSFAQLLYANAAFPLLRTRSGVDPLVIYYHIVSDQKVPHIDNLYSFRKEREFERDIDMLLKFYHEAVIVEVSR